MLRRFMEAWLCLICDLMRPRSRAVAMAASLTGEPRFEVGHPHMSRPAGGLDDNQMRALIGGSRPVPGWGRLKSRPAIMTAIVNRPGSFGIILNLASAPRGWIKCCSVGRF